MIFHKVNQANKYGNCESTTTTNEIEACRPLFPIEQILELVTTVLHIS